MNIALRETQSPTENVHLMEIVVTRQNMWRANRRVLANKGAPGMDGMTVGQLKSYLKRCWPKIKQALLDGTYEPLLSNIVLDQLDKELEQRGLRFVRYADDCVIYVRSKRAAERVMQSVSRYITRKLRLKVNPDKSAVSHPWWRAYLGFSFTSRRDNPRIRIHSSSIKRTKQRVRQLTSRSGGRSLEQVIDRLNQYLKGWWNYFGKAEVAAGFKSINYWIIRRLRAIVWPNLLSGRKDLKMCISIFKKDANASYRLSFHA